MLLLSVNCSNTPRNSSIDLPKTKEDQKVRSAEYVKCEYLVNKIKEIGNNHRSLTELCKLISNDSFYSNWKITQVFGTSGINTFIDASNMYGRIPGLYYVFTYSSNNISYSIQTIIDGKMILARNLKEFCNDTGYHSMNVNKYVIKLNLTNDTAANKAFKP